MEKILIIGGVAAGATAAAKARRLSADAEITILEAGADISFANCGLPYYIGGDIKSRSKLILQSPESFKEQYQTTVHIHTAATQIDRAQKKVYAEDTRTGEKKVFEYTKLILAQGGKPIAPPLPGADLDHVFQLWTLEDMDRITAFIEDKKPKTAVVVGGGFIGLEMTEALAKRGLKVSVVEMMPHVMGIMEAEIAGFIQEELVSYGVSLYTDKALAEIESKQVKLKDGTRVEADMVLMSIGVRPTLKLAQESGLELGNAGGLLVDETLKTSDESIYAAGDMIELEHRILGKKVRIPLAGPANRQGRIAAENALGKTHAYKGSIGTSIVRVFEAVAGTTGISLKAARAEGINADAIVVHKEHHTSYYPGAEMVSVMVVYDKDTGTILGGQTAGYEGADRRLDVLATAVASKLTVSDLSDIDFAYSPPLGNANDAINMAAYTAENRITGFSPALTASELDYYLVDKKPLWIDVRDVFSFERAHVEGAINIPLEILFTEMNQLPKDKLILVYDQTGKKGHQALRLLKGAGFDQVINVSGGFISLSNYVRAMTPKGFGLDLPAPEVKTLGQTETENSEPVVQEEVTPEPPAGPLVIDVRTGEEYAYGAVPGAINISLDALEYEIESLNDKDRKIILYCATGARSAYGVQLLQAYGFTNVENGGGLSRMMARVRSGKL
ncbi:FAD-dependent oxidoreductase [Fusibacter tunisiensis]|uniref:NADPH-dependent 2,4-dienoyl-CoA reductase/sulfur reductase-like enzyme/rhodanese-related sulfurtransferase n=1 Tax=Fusibacter tunisiensis TaxID=1008308 RepID=A0ABS2MSP2_9FIRM|nr:FAD-dependent oxidoreductase [Fusibacter tunisiensis]MBM7562413.1 NADPH-dependent 2,4-dienoyl-CoA reductase/sulfur reductase-like enzyme/rhodanese-related sulfurtransferase [Fusibacter tunisiensis]